MSAVLDFPARLVTASPGLALHADSDQIRIVYRSKEDAEDYEKPTADKSHHKLRLRSFPSDDIKGLMDFVKSNVCLSKTSLEVHYAGELQDGLEDALKEKLNIRLKPLQVLTCVSGAHQFLFQHVPTNVLMKQDPNFITDLDAAIADNDRFLRSVPSFIDLTDWVIFEDRIKEYKKFLVRSSGRKVPGEMEEKKPVVDGVAEMEDSSDYYPCLIVNLEENVKYMKVAQSGEDVEVLNNNSWGTDSLLALGSLLIGTTNLDDFMELAAKGDFNNVNFTDKNQMNLDKQTEEQKKNNQYSQMFDHDAEPYTMFCLGQAERKTISEFKKEDVAAALVYYTLANIVANSLQFVGGKVKHLMASGPMLDYSFSARLFAKLYYLNVIMFSTFLGQNVEAKVKILEHGTYYAALGAFINSVDKFHP